MKRYLTSILAGSALCAFHYGAAQVPAKATPISATPVQTAIPAIEAPTVAGLLKTVMALQKQVNTMQKQIDIDNRAQDLLISALQNKDVQLANSIGDGNSKIIAFKITASASNLADAFAPMTNTLSGTYYRTVIIDNAACNNNPAALVMVTAQRSSFYYNLPTGISVTYDGGIGKWKIEINPDETNSMVPGEAKPVSGQYVVSVASYSPYQILTGDKFNVAVIK